MKYLVLLAISLTLLFAACSNNSDKSSPIETTDLKDRIPSTAKLADETDKTAIYINVEGTCHNDINKVSVIFWDKQDSIIRFVYRDSTYNIFSAHIIPYTDTCKVLLEGNPDMHNIFSFILTEGKDDAIMLSSLGGLVGFGNDEGVIIMQSYQYYQKGGRYTKIDAYDQYGNKIASMKTNLKPDYPVEI